MILIGIGASIPSSFGTTTNTMKIVPHLLFQHGMKLIAGSFVYSTAPIGRFRQWAYLNSVVSVRTLQSPSSLLTNLKMIEKRAGRRGGARWSPRPLDLDIIAYHDLIFPLPGMLSRSETGICEPPDYDRFLILPHPSMQIRPFVLRPLLDIAPYWRHPVTHEMAFRMWRRIHLKKEGRILHKYGPLLADKRICAEEMKASTGRVL
ncbi:MAG: 2-amino-4-hydroxy-6-hydroxymethyldihydropteridine diphosphokinase [Alphaproteobacteria bacterium]|nr:2-amino-4-hydroxy-6-hydroxymethyldihydropteridine diphosphokinase [Alphaproteobacteria bacterium]